jgi:hypothetical protein
MLRRYRFYISLHQEEGEPGKICSCGAWKPARAAPAERGRPPERLLRSVDARQSCACGAWTPRGAILADFGGSKRAGVPGKNLLAVYKQVYGWKRPTIHGAYGVKKCAKFSPVHPPPRRRET